MKYLCNILIVILFSFPCLIAYDLTVVGLVIPSDGIGKLTIDIIETLKEDIKINCIPSMLITDGLNEETREIIEQPDKTPGTVSLLTNGLWHKHINPPLYTYTPNSQIKIAYSMLESSSIPSEWVAILNSFFDAVVVPDRFLVEVYKESGVEIPIFELPIGMCLNQYFETEKHQHPSNPFVFGTTVSCDERKNFSLMIESFAEEFGNRPDVLLKINSRQGNVKFYQQLIASLNVTNIIFTHDTLSKPEYIKFLNSFDCFINLSKGEGFSLCPREALALAIPCILTRNSTQTTICDSCLVREVPAPIPEPAYYDGVFGELPIGMFYTCTKEDVKAAMSDVLKNYSYYQELSKKGPEWVAQYNWSSLKKKYLNLIKPKMILLGDKNELTDDYFMTNSPQLYQKYYKAFQ